jgi:hypothetical protein
MPRKTVTEKPIVVSTGAAAAAPARRKSPAKRVAKTSEAAGAAALIEPTPTEPTHAEIAALAYSYWEARGCVGGSQEEDWLRAEQKLRSR